MAGEKIEDYDFYAKSVEVKDHYLGSFTLVPGKHMVRFECVGRNPFSRGRHLGLDSVRLRERWNRKRKLLTFLVGTAGTNGVEKSQGMLRQTTEGRS